MANDSGPVREFPSRCRRLAETALEFIQSDAVNFVVEYGELPKRIGQARAHRNRTNSRKSQIEFRKIVGRLNGFDRRGGRKIKRTEDELI